MTFYKLVSAIGLGLYIILNGVYPVIAKEGGGVKSRFVCKIYNLNNTESGYTTAINSEYAFYKFTTLSDGRKAVRIIYRVHPISLPFVLNIVIKDGKVDDNCFYKKDNDTIINPKTPWLR